MKFCFKYHYKNFKANVWSTCVRFKSERCIGTLKVQLHAIFVSLEVKNGQFQVYEERAHYISGRGLQSGAEKLAKINRHLYGGGTTLLRA